MQNIAVESVFTQPIPIKTHNVLQIRNLLEKSGYVEVTTRAIAQSDRGTPIALNIRGPAGTPVETLLRLFFFGEVAGQDSVRRALQPMLIDDWLESGLIALQNHRIAPLVKFIPCRGLVLITDIKWTPEFNSHQHSVMGICGSSKFLARLTVRKPSRLTLDMGTGTGIQALLAARHSEQVIAVDLNPRALEFARFNASLNGISNIEFIEGDLFEPVHNRKFDLIISNPPFVISPENRCLYRDNPLGGDDFVRQLVHEMPQFLSDGGFGQIICNWIQPKNKSWASRLKLWFKDNGCDNWVLRDLAIDIPKYIETWLQCDNPPDLERRKKRWIDYYCENDIASIGFGLITMHRSDCSNHWTRIDRSLPAVSHAAGEHLYHSFRCQTFLHSNKNDSDLLEQKYQVAPTVRLAQQSSPLPDGRWDLASAQLSLIEGIQWQVTLDMKVLDAVLLCGPTKTLREIFDRVAARHGRSADTLSSTYSPAFRALISMGFLWPIELDLGQTQDSVPISESTTVQEANIQNLVKWEPVSSVVAQMDDQDVSIGLNPTHFN